MKGTRYVPMLGAERRAAKRRVVGFNECASLNKLQDYRVTNGNKYVND